MMKNYRKERSSSSSETPRIEAAFRRDDGKWCAWPSLCVSLFWHDKYWKYKIHTRTSIRTHSTLLSAFCTTPWVSGRRGKKPEPCAPMTRHCTSNSHHSHTQSEEIFAFDHTSFHTVFFLCVAPFREGDAWRGRVNLYREIEAIQLSCFSIVLDACFTSSVDSNYKRCFEIKIIFRQERERLGMEKGISNLFWPKVFGARFPPGTCAGWCSTRKKGPHVVWLGDGRKDSKKKYK